MKLVYRKYLGPVKYTCSLVKDDGESITDPFLHIYLEGNGATKKLAKENLQKTINDCLEADTRRYTKLLKFVTLSK